ncbi:MAG: sugar ABC transporter permease [Firmicutes bacterium]|nr:sugar ABC transporter permease [Bacillota bacterium]
MTTRTVAASKSGKLLNKLFPYLLLAPAFILVIVLNYIPIGESVLRSLYDWRGGSRATFVGLANFKELFQDMAFHISMKNMIKLLVFQLVVILTVPLLAAEYIFRLKNHPVLQNAFRVLFVLPMVVPRIVTVLIWQFIYDGDVGLLNGILKGLGLVSLARPWLDDPRLALYAIMFVGFPWVSGVATLIYLAGLENVESTVWDSCELDGARGLRRVFAIDIPLIFAQLRTMAVLTVIEVIGGYMFVDILVLTGGGPGWATMVPGLNLYENAFKFSRMGYACAMGLTLSLIALFITLLNMSLFGKKVDE